MIRALVPLSWDPGPPRKVYKSGNLMEVGEWHDINIGGQVVVGIDSVMFALVALVVGQWVKNLSSKCYRDREITNKIGNIKLHSRVLMNSTVQVKVNNVTQRENINALGISCGEDSDHFRVQSQAVDERLLDQLN